MTHHLREALARVLSDQRRDPDHLVDDVYALARDPEWRDAWLGVIHVRISGRCPSCGSTTLFVGSGGHVTCALLGCTDPCLADKILHGEVREST